MEPSPKSGCKIFKPLRLFFLFQLTSSLAAQNLGINFDGTAILLGLNLTYLTTKLLFSIFYTNIILPVFTLSPVITSAMCLVSPFSRETLDFPGKQTPPQSQQKHLKVIPSQQILHGQQLYLDEHSPHPQQSLSEKR